MIDFIQGKQRKYILKNKNIINQTNDNYGN